MLVFEWADGPRALIYPIKCKNMIWIKGNLKRILIKFENIWLGNNVVLFPKLSYRFLINWRWWQVERWANWSGDCKVHGACCSRVYSREAQWAYRGGAGRIVLSKAYGSQDNGPPKMSLCQSSAPAHIIVIHGKRDFADVTKWRISTWEN